MVAEGARDPAVRPVPAFQSTAALRAASSHLGLLVLSHQVEVKCLQVPSSVASAWTSASPREASACIGRGLHLLLVGIELLFVVV